MPELLWTDALHDAPTLPPPRPRCASATSVEVPRPQRIPLDGIVDGSMSALRVSHAALPSQGFDPRASAALPLVRRAAARVPCIIDSGESTTQLNFSAESSTALYVRSSRERSPSSPSSSVQASATTASPVERFCMLMTQALPLVRINDSERLERRATAERVAIVVVGAMAAVMTMLAIASALARLLA